MQLNDMNKLAASIHEAVVYIRKLEDTNGFYFHESLSLALVKCHEAASIVEGNIADYHVEEQSEEFQQQEHLAKFGDG